MTVYTYSEARQNLASVLDQARRAGEVRIRRRDGQVFVVRPERRTGSPLDVRGIDVGLTAEEIVASVRESRSRSAGSSNATDSHRSSNADGKLEEPR